MSSTVVERWQRLLPHLRKPIILGPMAGAAGGALAAQTSRAGGLGFIGAGYMTNEQLDKELQTSRTILETKEGEILPVGVGYLGWNLTKFDAGKSGGIDKTLSIAGTGNLSMERPEATKRIDIALQHRVQAIWLGFGNAQDITFWSKAIRSRATEILGDEHGGKLALFVSAGTNEEAAHILRTTDADVIVAQGVGAGGHGFGKSPPLLELTKDILKQLNNLEKQEKRRPLLIGGGGLSDGTSLVSLLSAGADGGVFGTRYLITPESTYHETRKKVLEDACGKDGNVITQRSMAFDEARNTLGWPEGVDGRGIVNKTVEDFEQGNMDMKARQERYTQAEKEDDKERLIVWSGTGIERMKKDTSRLSAYDVTELLWKEAQSAWQDIHP